MKPTDMLIRAEIRQMCHIIVTMKKSVLQSRMK